MREKEDNPLNRISTTSLLPLPGNNINNANECKNVNPRMVNCRGGMLSKNINTFVKEHVISSV